MPFTLPPSPILVAHRGNGGPAPENTRAALEEAIALGVDMVEIDVRLSRDGVPVMFHNPTLDETTDGRGRVDEHSLEALKRLDAGSWKGDAYRGQRILTLREGLTLAQGHVAVNLDLKTPRAVKQTVAVVQEMRMEDAVIITGCTWRTVQRVREQRAQLTVLLNLDEHLETLARAGRWALFRKTCLEQAQRAGADGLNLPHQCVDEVLVEAAHGQGLSVWAWTVDERRRLEQLLELGVDGVTTNWPERMIDLFEETKLERGSREV